MFDLGMPPHGGFAIASGRTIAPDPNAGPINGPTGDLYLFSHLQVDAQGSFRIRRDLQFIAAGLNLNNEVLGSTGEATPFLLSVSATSRRTGSVFGGSL